MSVQSHSKAVQQWQQYIDEKAQVTIRPTPKSFACTQPFVVVPESDRNFVLGDFSSIESATRFCNQNGLPISAK